MSASDVVYAATALVEMCAIGDEAAAGAAGAGAAGGTGKGGHAEAATASISGHVAPTRLEAFSAAYDCLGLKVRRNSAS